MIVLKSAEETAGAFFDASISRAKFGPPRDHIHTHQEERVEVVEGTVRCRVAGKEHVLEPGMVMVIPAGTSHAVWSEDRGVALDGEYWRR